MQIKSSFPLTTKEGIDELVHSMITQKNHLRVSNITRGFCYIFICLNVFSPLKSEQTQNEYM